MSQATDYMDVLRGGVAAGMDDNELPGLVEQVKKTRQALERTRGGVDDMEGALRSAVAQIGDRMLLEAAAKKRALALQATARIKAVDYVLSTFSGQEEKGLSRLLVGGNYAKDSARMSIDAQQVSLGGYYIGGLLSDIHGLGDTHLELFRRGVMDFEVARALFDMDNPEVKRLEGPREAKEVAEVIHKWQEKARGDANLSGAWVGKLPGYIVQQSHDRAKMRRAGFAAWQKFLARGGEDGGPLLDWSKIQDGMLITPEQRTEFLRAAFDHITVGRESRNAPNALGGPNSSAIDNAAAKLSHERVLFFTDADAWTAYNQQFGLGNLREAVLHGLTSSARATALMRGLGPFPQRNFDAIFTDVRGSLHERGNMEAVRRLDDARGALTGLLREVDGSLNRGDDASPAAVGRFVRTWQDLTGLGKALMASFADAPGFAGEFAYQGRSFLDGMAEGIGGLVEGRNGAEKQNILAQLGVFFDGMAAAITAGFSGEELPGRMTRLQNMVFTLNGLNWWTDAWRRSAALMLSHGLALERGMEWRALSKERRRLLSMYGIDAEKWDIVRRGGTRAADGREYLTPEAMDDVQESVLAGCLQRRGQEVTAPGLENLRRDLRRRLRAYFRDRLDAAVLTPDAQPRGIPGQETAAGAPVNEVLRFIMRFRSFPAARMPDGMDRETGGQAHAGDTSSFINFSRLFLMTTLLGYGSMVAREWLAGTPPRAPEDAADFAGIVMAAAAQGGGLGIYADFLLGEALRMDGGPATSLPGQISSALSDASGIYTRVRDGDGEARAALRSALGSTPGTPQWWLRAAFDYAIGYSLFNWIRPGFLERARRRIETENSRTFWMRPRAGN